MEESSGIERVGRDDRSEVEVFAGRRTVVSALPLKRAARQRLAQLLDARVVDIRDECPEAELVLTPSSSPQLVGMLQRRYPGARIVAVELDDEEYDVELGGPVKRLLGAGVDGYLLADSLEDLATRLRPSGSPPSRAPEPSDDVAELPVGTPIDEVIAAFVRQATGVAEPIRRSDDA